MWCRACAAAGITPTTLYALFPRLAPPPSGDTEGKWPAPNYALLGYWNDPSNERPQTRGNLRNPDEMPPETQQDCAHHLYVGEVHQEAYNSHLMLDLLGVPSPDGNSAELDARVSILAQQFGILSERLHRIEGWHSRETGEHGTFGDNCDECGHVWPCDTARMADGTYTEDDDD